MTEEIRLNSWNGQGNTIALPLYKVTLFSSRIGICGSRILRLAACSLL